MYHCGCARVFCGGVNKTHQVISDGQKRDLGMHLWGKLRVGGGDERYRICLRKKAQIDVRYRREK